MTKVGASKITVVPWEADAKSRAFTYVGPHADDLLGYPKNEWYQSDFWLKHIHPDDREGAAAFCEAAAASGMGYELEYRMIGAQGQVVWLRDVVHVVRDEDGACFLQGFKIDITETRRAEEAQKLLHRDQQVIFNSVPAMIWYKDANNKILRCNKLAAESRGLTVEDMEGHLTEELYPDEAAKYLADDLDVIRSGKPKLGIIERYEIATGEKRWVRTDKIPYRNENEEIIGVIVFATDVTNLKQNEDHLGAVLNFTRSILWHASIILERDRYGWEFHISNEAHAQQVLPLLVPPNSLYAREWMKSRHPDDAVDWEKHSDAALRQGQKTLRLETRHYNMHGQLQRFSEEITLYPVATDRWTAVGVSVDITEAHKKNEQLQLSERRLKIQTHTSISANGILSPTGRILSGNAAFANLAGFSTENEALFHNMGDCFPTPNLFEELVSKIKTDKKIHHAEYPWTRRDGASTQIRLNAEGLFTPNGELLEIFISAVDIGRQKNTEEEYEEAQQWITIGKLTGGIAHDFNNLLTSVLGYGRMILDKTDAQDTTHKDVERIVSAGERAASLTRQILALGRKKTAAPRSLNINAVVSDMDHLLRRTLGEDIELVTLLEENIPTVHGVPGLIERMIAELALMTRRRLALGGKLIIQTSQSLIDASSPYSPRIAPGSYTTLFVRCTAQPLPPSDKHADAACINNVKYLARQMSGTVHENTEGTSASYSIFFPVTMPAPTPQTALAADALPHGGETILVVEDENMVRDLSVRMLLSLGYRVLQARSGDDAINLIATHPQPIDLILSDVVMPQMSGPAMIERLRDMGKKHKVLFMSGYNEEEMFKNASLDGSAQLLPKPFTRKALAYKIRQILDNPSS